MYGTEQLGKTTPHKSVVSLPDLNSYTYFKPLEGDTGPLGKGLAYIFTSGCC